MGYRSKQLLLIDKLNKQSDEDNGKHTYREKKKQSDVFVAKFQIDRRGGQFRHTVIRANRPARLFPAMFLRVKIRRSHRENIIPSGD